MMLGMQMEALNYTHPSVIQIDKMASGMNGWMTREGSPMAAAPPSSLAYETAPTAGTYLSYEPEDYVRLRINSNSDPFIGIPQLEQDREHFELMNDPFGDLDEELPWLESFTDLTNYQDNFDFGAASPIEEEIEKRSTDVNWEEWDRFLRENHPVEYQYGSGRSSPILIQCEDYIPNFALNEYEGQCKEMEKQELRIEQPLIEDFLDVNTNSISTNSIASSESPAPRFKPKRGRPRLPKPARPNKRRFSPIDDEDDEDDLNPSDHRRRALNRDAAFRYRERKKALKDAIFSQAEELESRNNWLHSRVSMLTQEIKRMRSHLEDMGAIDP